MGGLALSVVVPVYRNEGSLDELVERLAGVAREWAAPLEAVFVVDGSPDASEQRLLDLLPKTGLPAQVLSLSRNFGSFAAIRAGLAAGRGELFAVMAADLQEPPELVLELAQKLQNEQLDLAVGTRVGRGDRLFVRVTSSAFWGTYRRFVLPEMPRGGVDVFACTRRFRDQILALPESRSTLVGLLFWLGFRRGEVSYHRLPRRHGSSAWSVRRRVRYMLDSIFAFSDLPLRVLEAIGLLGMAIAVFLAGITVAARLTQQTQVPGYAATTVLILFFGGLNTFGIGILGEYVARAFENTKRRPPWIVGSHHVIGQAIGKQVRSEGGES